MTVRIFSHNVSWMYLILFVTEWLIFFASMFFSDNIRFMFSKNWYAEDYVPFASLFFATMLSSAAFGLGLYRRSLAWNQRELLARVGISFVAAMGFLTLFLALIPDPNFTISKGVLAISLVLAFAGMMLSRFIFYRLTKQSIFEKNLLIIGGGENAKMIIESNMGYIHRGFKVVGCLVLPRENIVVDSALILDSSGGLIDLVERYQVDEIVVSIEDRRGVLPIRELVDCKMSGVLISDLRTFFEREKALVYLENLMPSWFIFSDGFGKGGGTSVIKRIIDVFASLILLAVSWPFMLITTIAIMIESGVGSPIFYRQTRVGENNEPFDVIKFRSMKLDAELKGAQMAKANDDRITKVGHIIRKYRIDELPQILNVLYGDMSFVGPRPERPQFVAQFNENIPFYNERHRVKPGITGWAQVCYPYGENEEDAVQKLQYDLYYIKNMNIFLDITILFYTIETILWGKGSR